MRDETTSELAKVVNSRNVEANQYQAPEIGGDVLFQVLQFMQRKHQRGLIMFEFRGEMNKFKSRMVSSPGCDFLFYTPQNNSFRFESTWLYMVCAEDRQQAMRYLMGQQFTKAWYVGNIVPEIKQLAQSRLLLTSGE